MRTPDTAKKFFRCKNMWRVMERVSLCHGALAWGGRIYTDWEGKLHISDPSWNLWCWRGRSDFYSACGAACDFQWKRGAHAVGTYVFHMDFLGAKAADICAIRYLNPLMNQKLIPPFVIKKGHPLYEKAADLFEDINTEYDKKTPGYEIAIKSYLLQLVAALIPYCTRNTEADAILTEHAKS